MITRVQWIIYEFFWTKLKKRGTDGVVRGGSGTFQLAQGSIFVRLPNRLRRELIEVLQSFQFFCLTIGWLKTEILDIFEKSLTHFELLGPQNWSKIFFEKIEKIGKMMNFFSLFLFVLCSVYCIMFPKLVYSFYFWFYKK